MLLGGGVGLCDGHDVQFIGHELYGRQGGPKYRTMYHNVCFVFSFNLNLKVSSTVRVFQRSEFKFNTPCHIWVKQRLG